MSSAYPVDHSRPVNLSVPRQDPLCLGQRQPQIRNVTKIAGPADLHHVDISCPAVSPRFDQLQNPPHTRSPSRQRPDRSYRSRAHTPSCWTLPNASHQRRPGVRHLECRVRCLICSALIGVCARSETICPQPPKTRRQKLNAPPRSPRPQTSLTRFRCPGLPTPPIRRRANRRAGARTPLCDPQ
jgi:hypothetical protein